LVAFDVGNSDETDDFIQIIDDLFGNAILKEIIPSIYDEKTLIYVGSKIECEKFLKILKKMLL
jgi:hypothetical protein